MELREVRQAAPGGCDEGWIVRVEALFRPEAEDVQSLCLAVKLRVDACGEAVTIQHRQHIVAPSTLLGGLVDFPDIFEIEDRLCPAARADDIKRREECYFVS